MAKRTLPLSKIRLDGNTQPRVELDEFLINEYKEAYQSKAEMPPLEVMFDGASYWLWDGFHRRWGAERAGLEKLPCNVTEGTQQDAQWASYGANKAHGARRNRRDLEKAIKAALRHPKGKKSDNSVAKQVGVDHKTVAKYRAELEATREIPKSDERTGDDGRTINTSNIGKGSSRWTGLDNETQRKVKSGEISVGQANAIFDTKHHPVAADDSDDDDQASGGAARVTSGSLAGMEPDSAGVSEPQELDRVRWAKEQFGLLWKTYNAAFGDEAAWCYFSTGWEEFKEEVIN